MKTGGVHTCGHRTASGGGVPAAHDGVAAGPQRCRGTTARSGRHRPGPSPRTGSVRSPPWPIMPWTDACPLCERNEMTHDTADRPDDEEIAVLLSEILRIYRFGAPVLAETGADGDGDGDGSATALWHEEVLADLADPANDDPHGFAAVAHGHSLDTAAGLRDLVRLSAAEAAACALRFVLARTDPSTGERTHGGAVVDAILTREWWPPGPTVPSPGRSRG